MTPDTAGSCDVCGTLVDARRTVDFSNAAQQKPVLRVCALCDDTGTVRTVTGGPTRASWEIALILRAICVVGNAIIAELRLLRR